MKLQHRSLFAFGLTLAQLSAPAVADVSYNLNNFDSNGLSGNDGGLPPIWTNPAPRISYAGALNAMWVAELKASSEFLEISTEDALKRTYTVAAQTNNAPNGYWLAVGAKSWFDSAAGAGWGHGLDFGLVRLVKPGNLTITVEADNNSLIPAITVYKGWDSSATSSRHASFVDKQDNPLNETANLTYLASKAGTTAGAPVTLTLSGLDAGQYAIFVGGNDSAAGGYKYKITLEKSPALYSVIDLGVLGDGAWSVANGVSNSGAVSGYSRYDAAISATHAFRYSAGAMHDLGAMKPDAVVSGGTYSRGYNINDAGAVVGYSFFQSGLKTPAHPALFNPDGTITDIGTFRPDNDGNGTAHDINRWGTVAGYAANGDAGSINYIPFLWNKGTLTALGSFGGTRGKAYALNGSNQVVGWSFTAGDAQGHAFLYSGGQMIDLHGELAVNVPDSTGSESADINDGGAVVGGIFSPGGTHPFLYRSGVVTELGWLPGGGSAKALSVNDKNRIVGYSYIAGTSGQTHGFLYDGKGRMRDLNTLVTGGPGWEITSANAISNTGYIAGTGLLNGADHALLLKPIALAHYPLSVAKSANGAVLSEPAGIDCGEDCDESFEGGTEVKLTATPSAGYYFSRWAGACQGTGDCLITTNKRASVRAIFKPIKQ